MRHPLHARRRRACAILALPLLAAGCASFSPDGGMVVPASIARSELSKDAVKLDSAQAATRARSHVNALLSAPLTADAAVQTALYNNRGLQAAYNQLGMSEADFVEATLPENPTLSVGALVGGGITEIEARILSSLLDLATLPKRRQIAEVRFRQAQLAAAGQTLGTAMEARRAFFEAVAAHQTVHALERAQLSADAASELTDQLGRTGGLRRIDQSRQHAFTAEVSAELGRARQQEKAARERLVRAMGLWGNDLDFKIPGRLPTPPGIAAMDDIEREAIRRRVDLQSARLELEAMARSLNLDEDTRYVSLLEVAGTGMWERETAGDEREETVRGGLELELAIPVFDHGGTRLRRSEQAYMKAANDLVALAVNVRSEAREAYQRYRGAHDLARHYRGEILPLRQSVTDESLLLYNTMNIDVLDLLADVRAQVDSEVAAIAAERDFWLAAADLTAALSGGGIAGGSSETAIAAAGGDGGGH